MTSLFHRDRARRCVGLLGCIAFSWISTSMVVRAQATAAPETAVSADKRLEGPSTELATHDEPATFKSKVNLVLVPVVVRGRDGKPVKNLTKDDFVLTDRGKAQVISSFSVETASGKKPEAPPANTNPSEPVPPPAPEHFIAYLFDDVHLSVGDLAQARAAAEKHMSTSLRATDRAAIFTTSGRNNFGFTDSLPELRQALLKLQPHPIAMNSPNDCPDISYYMADLISNKQDQIAIQAATADTFICMQLQDTPGAQEMARSQALAAARRVLEVNNNETHVTMTVIKDVVRALSLMPGQRNMVFASPGFLIPEARFEESDIIDRAIRANVVINTLDARGLYVPNADDITKPARDSTVARMISQYGREAASANSGVLQELAVGTGGGFFQNRNDLEAGFDRLAATPETIYVLGFSPQNLKLDGSFHALKVSIKENKGLSLQARTGYYSPKHAIDPGEQAKEEIREALFSQQELHDLPVQLKTQFFKPDEENAKLAVVVQVDVQHMHFKKVEGRNRNELTIVSGIFDRNGNYLQGIEKTLTMQIRDETLPRLARGLTLKTNFDVKPGSYMVRLVVRDSEGQLMSAANTTVEIP